MPSFSPDNTASNRNQNYDLQSQLTQQTAMPAACAQEHGDYSDGDYSVAVLTRSAPDMADSNFSQTLMARSQI